MTKADTVGLVGDGDDIDLLEAIESSFQVEFGEAAAKCFTVGDLYETLLGLVPTSSVPCLCATSMAFYRIRSTLCRVTDHDAPIKPSTRLSDLTTLSPKRLNARLEQEHGLARLPLRLSVQGGLGLAVLLSGVVGGVMAVALPLLWPILLLIPIGFAMVRLDEGAHRDTTVGDLARDVARRNFSHFASGGADTHPAALWHTLCELVSEETGTTPVTAQTRLFAWPPGGT
ncbi:hypothetical protein DBR21_02685 [Caulobacter sp. HMWF009]|nr:hypothetical protein DBR21_02685 [Caulobacter sp. HMWF009]PTT06494.1 hypothetical protein DBR10_12640 [Caulobacter sp. HMWF025]